MVEIDCVDSNAAACDQFWSFFLLRHRGGSLNFDSEDTNDASDHTTHDPCGMENPSDPETYT